jgi:hypothetical protein
MDNPWINHGYQGILFVAKWHAIQVERISTRPVSMIVRCASLDFSRFSGFHGDIAKCFVCKRTSEDLLRLLLMNYLMDQLINALIN